MRITADDARVPISHAQAAMGVDGDVSTTPPGVYTVPVHLLPSGRLLRLE